MECRVKAKCILSREQKARLSHKNYTKLSLFFCILVRFLFFLLHTEQNKHIMGKCIKLPSNLLNITFMLIHWSVGMWINLLITCLNKIVIYIVYVLVMYECMDLFWFLFKALFSKVWNIFQLIFYACYLTGYIPDMVNKINHGKC